ncbi:lipopolysaccharide biosynthesis protein [Paenarthrobacter nitroguajacolicus]|uniref:lipopolysaccharide biosynthesis protein n=1 Tax=Paenarthrobacter nitroguajacolicus TaxID=211146 RepID=UPI003D1A436D
MTSATAQKAARGGLITLVGQGAKMVLLLVNLVVLGRLLTPQDFGLVAMVTAIVGVAELIRDFGITTASIQAPTLSRKQKSNLFLINTGLGLFLAAVSAAASLPIAGLYDDQRLIPITLAISCIFLLNGIQAQYQVEMNRSLRFKALTLTDVVANSLALLAGITAALLGAGYWALVILQVTAALILLISRIAISNWHPGWPGPSGKVKKFLHYGGNLGVAQFINYISANAPGVLIGYAFGPSILGAYSRASQIATIPINQVFGPLTNVALTTLIRLSDDDHFNRSIVKIQLILGYSAALAFSFVAAFASPLVVILLGHQWGAVVPLLQALCIGTAFQAATFVSYWVFLSKGQTSELLRYNLVTKGIVLALTVAGSFIGVAGAVWGYSLGLALAWPISLMWMKKTNVPAMQLFLGGLRFFLVGACAAILGILLPLIPNMPPLVGLIAGWSIGIVIPLVIPSVRRDVFSMTGVFMGLVSSKSRILEAT